MLFLDEISNSFSIWADGKVLCVLPVTCGFTEALGEPDPYTWERAPYTDHFFPLGDRFRKQKEILRIGGKWTYETVEEALTHIEEIKKAMRGGKEVYWLGKKLGILRSDYTGAYFFKTGSLFIEVTHDLALYVDMIDWEGFIKEIGKRESDQSGGTNGGKYSRYIWSRVWIKR